MYYDEVTTLSEVLSPPLVPLIASGSDQLLGPRLEEGGYPALLANVNMAPVNAGRGLRLQVCTMCPSLVNLWRYTYLEGRRRTGALKMLRRRAGC